MNILSSILVFVCVVTNVLAVTVMVEDTISESHTSIFTSGTDSDIPCASEHVYRDADGSTRMTAVNCATFAIRANTGMCSIPGNLFSPYPGCCSAPGPCSILSAS